MSDDRHDHPPPVPSGEPAPRRALTLDLAAYEPFFADQTIGEEDKRALLEALWSIIVGFVDLGFHIHPVQQVGPQDDAEVCGQNHQEMQADAPSVVGSDGSTLKLRKAFAPSGPSARREVREDI